MGSRFSRRRFLGLGIMTLSGAALPLIVACQPTSPAPTPKPAEPKAAPQTPQQPTPTPAQQVPTTEKITLRVTHTWPAERAKIQPIFDQKFMERHPNIVVKSEIIPWAEYRSKFVTQAAGGILPDVMYMQFSWAQQWIRDGVIIDLEPFIKAQPDFNREDFFPAALVPYIRNGKLYAVPYDISIAVLYYNRDLFDKAGVAYPNENWTFDDLLAAAKKLTGGEGPNKVYGFHPVMTLHAGVAPTHFYPFGAKVLNEPEETECLLTEPAATRAAEFWMSFVHEHKVTPRPADIQGMQLAQGSPFVSGRVAMELQGSWFIPNYARDAKFKWDIADWPKGPAGRFTWALNSAYGISSTTKYRDAAWTYLHEYMSPEGSTLMWASSGDATPARQSVWDVYLKTLSRWITKPERFKEMLKYANGEVIRSPVGPEITAKMAETWDRVILGELQVRPALEKICSDLKPILAKNRTS